MLICYSIVGEAEGQPITCTTPLGACSRLLIAPLAWPVSFVGAPVAGSMKQNTGGTKAS